MKTIQITNCLEQLGSTDGSEAANSFDEKVC